MIQTTADYYGLLCPHLSWRVPIWIYPSLPPFRAFHDIRTSLELTTSR